MVDAEAADLVEAEAAVEDSEEAAGVTEVGVEEVKYFQFSE